ncbi:pro-resilin-like [Maniola jurtina]|uniref:pro-resilin-like n=1 Tax=Maniola jurtina TaxID=191418 RepID=UPI001E68F27E|nr:pro-resilin-like [Maniola jurtina]
MKGLLVFLLLVVSTLAEPPIDNRYLPPQSFSSSPSQAYGLPGFGGQRQSGAGFRGRLSATYGAPSRSQSLSNQYIPPRSSNQYQAASSSYQAPTSQYQAPTSQFQARSSQYQAPSSQYQARSSLNQASSSYQAPSSQYGLPNQALGSAGSYAAPSQEYGLPGLGRGGSQGLLGGNEFSQSRQYLPPGGRSGYDDGSNGAPANYNFEYMVLDQYSGNDFGHRESRQGDRAEGVYYVLLPDGRKQTVQYEADQDGYKPRISYEDTGRRASVGYDRNSQAYSSNQYENGPY